MGSNSVICSARTAPKCREIYEDQISGLRTIRPGLQTVLEVLREGDTLVVWKLDRLGRSVKGLVGLVSELEARKVHFRMPYRQH